MHVLHPLIRRTQDLLTPVVRVGLAAQAQPGNAPAWDGCLATAGPAAVRSSESVRTPPRLAYSLNVYT